MKCALNLHLFAPKIANWAINMGLLLCFGADVAHQSHIKSTLIRGSSVFNHDAICAPNIMKMCTK